MTDTRPEPVPYPLAVSGPLRPTASAAVNQPWWHNAVIYEIYPRSFADLNGDGIGDLPGITARLDYLANTLGVDAIWICPFYPSPLVDFGYDVADFTDVDPEFGTLADFETLVREAHLHGIHVIVDYIPNHTSDQHPWFTESRSSRDNAKRDWYIWADPQADGSPPNNWTSEMGGSTWELDPVTGQYYLHSFHRQQPDLNWRNPDLREAMLDVVRFWLDRGVDGIRIDVAHMIAKHPDLADNPVRSAPRRNETDRQHRDFDTQIHVNDRSHHDVHSYLGMIRDVLDEATAATGRERIAIGEIEVMPWEVWRRFFGTDGRGIHLPFNFQLIEAEWTPAGLAAGIEGQEAALPVGGWPNYVLQNHDRPRFATRVGPEHIRNAAMLLLTLRGTPTLYYGEELGLADTPIAPADWLDPLGRDESRAPMPWTWAPDGGFSGGRATSSWLPPYRDLHAISVRAQLDQSGSVLDLYRELIALRRSSAALLAGTYSTLRADKRVLCYLRTVSAQQMVVGLNLSGAAVQVELPRPGNLVLDTNGRRNGTGVITLIDLPPYSGAVIELQAAETS